MTICGRVASIIARTSTASTMSPITERIPLPTMDQRLGSVAGGKANPVTSAPSVRSHRLIQAPLNPVWPVKRTLRPCQKAVICMGLLLLRPSPIRCAPACMKTRALQTHPRAEADLQVPKFPQRANAQEHFFILAEALRPVSDFKRVADNCQRQFVVPLMGDGRIVHPGGKARLRGKNQSGHALHDEYLHLHLGLAPIRRSGR